MVAVTRRMEKGDQRWELKAERETGVPRSVGSTTEAVPMGIVAGSITGTASSGQRESAGGAGGEVGGREAPPQK